VKSGACPNGVNEMSSMEHHGYAQSVRPEYAILVLVAVLALGVFMSLQW
jgi:hypothetical protein